MSETMAFSRRRAAKGHEGAPSWPSRLSAPLGGRNEVTWGLSFLAFERVPHLDVALGGPDARIDMTGELVVAARHVERHAVVEDHPMPVLRPQCGDAGLVDRVQVLPRGDAGL